MHNAINEESACTYSLIQNRDCLTFNRKRHYISQPYSVKNCNTFGKKQINWIMCSSMGSLAYARRLGRHIVFKNKAATLVTWLSPHIFLTSSAHSAYSNYKASHMFLKTSTTSSMIQSSKLLIASKMSNALEIHSHHVSATHWMVFPNYT